MDSVSSVRIGTNFLALSEKEAPGSNLQESRPLIGVASGPGKSRPPVGQNFGGEGRARPELLAVAPYTCTLVVHQPGGDTYRVPVSSTSPGALNAEVARQTRNLESAGCTIQRR